MSDRGNGPVSFFEVVRRQRACRAFSDEPVSDDLVAQVLEAATYAPSAENAQPWEFVVVREEAVRQEIGRVFARAWESGGRDFAEAHLDEALFEDVDHGATGGIAGAPVLVVVAVDLRRTLETSAAASIFPAVQNLLLAATALGLGSALTTLATYLAGDLAGALGLPEHVRPMAIVPLGYPVRPLGRPRRDPFARHAHRDRYGNPW